MVPIPKIGGSNQKKLVIVLTSYVSMSACHKNDRKKPKEGEGSPRGHSWVSGRPIRKERTCRFWQISTFLEDSVAVVYRLRHRVANPMADWSPLGFWMEGFGYPDKSDRIEFAKFAKFL